MIFQNEINSVIQIIQTHSDELLRVGPIALFFLLALGVIALPIPDETLMLTAGFLIGKGKINGLEVVLASYLGSIAGISGSYAIGRFGGSVLVKKYGHWLRITEQKIERTRHWFSRLGSWLLFVGYFIPGVRHFTGYLVGTVHLDFRKFALFAYSGAIFWASTFLLAGYLLGR